MDYDYVVVGAGLAGLSLADSLSEYTNGKSIALIDPRKTFERDHTWCFWNNAIDIIDLPFTKNWQEWKVRYKAKSIVCPTSKYPYTCIFADAYYRQALDKLAKRENIKFLLGESLRTLRYDQAGISLKTVNQELSAKLVFDSRPPKVNEAGLCQDFFGLQIRCDKKVFNPNCLTLMDFSDINFPQSSGFHFYYVLPFSESEALIESVFVGTSRLQPGIHRQLVHEYLDKEFGIIDYAELYVEHGCIPMHSVRQIQTDNRHYFIGTAGGLVRSSTGYAFAAIHKFSHRLAKSLTTEEIPKPPPPLSQKSQLLDSILLTYIKQHPEQGPYLLSSLFNNVDPDIVVRFLCDCSSLQDDAVVLAAMPKKLELAKVLARICL